MPSVRLERTEARPIAAVRRSSFRQALGRDIIESLDTVWPVLRAQQVIAGHNVVVYHGGLEDLEIGVEVLSPFEETAEVRLSATPAGEVAVATHWGDYAAMMPAYAALERWFEESGRRRTGVSWEVYGDWAEEPSERRTDIYFLISS